MMKKRVSFICFMFFAFSSFLASAQEYNWNRYASAYVKSTDPDHEQKQIKENAELSALNGKGLQLFIPANPTILMQNGNRSIKVYLINNTNDTVGINRIDATIGQIETEIKVGKEWKLFQRNINSSCGNSYFRATLAAHSYYSIELQNNIPGNIKVLFRLVVYIDKQKIISNETTIQVSKDLLELAGTPIKAVSL